MNWEIDMDHPLFVVQQFLRKAYSLGFYEEPNYQEFKQLAKNFNFMRKLNKDLEEYFSNVVKSTLSQSINEF
jgi:predicted DNA binding protein